jgi:hypothetical protein
MKLTNKQLLEIDFLEKHYINNHQNDSEVCEARKKGLPLIDIKQWRTCLSQGLFWHQELSDDFNHPYFDKLVATLLKNIKFDYNKGFPEFHFLNVLKATRNI